MRLGEIQESLREAKLDGWLFCDFRGSDPVGASVLGLATNVHRTRRWFFYLPATGEPTRIVHAIEPGALDELPGTKKVYMRWQQLQQLVQESLTGCKRVAMQYSPHNAIPYVARVDAGTVDLIRSFGVEVVTSADLIQRFEATIDESQWESHRIAADKLGEIITEAFDEIGRKIRTGGSTDEFTIQQFILRRFEEEGLFTDHPPIVAVNANSADPHYAPEKDKSTSIRPGDFVLIDIWAKLRQPRSIFADITWTGYVGDQVPEKYETIFRIVRDARDAAIDQIRQAQAQGEPLRGCDVDDCCRKVIDDAGYGERFIHRTGHSIHEAGHGNGANIDNVESRDERRLIPRTCFSIEPGIYLTGDFGVRSEVDVFLPDTRQVIVTGIAPQKEIIRIL